MSRAPAIAAAFVIALWGGTAAAQPVPPAPLPSTARLPSPRIDATHDVDWFFAYKFNSIDFPTTGQLTSCRFGGSPQPDKMSQRYVVASSAAGALADGPGLIGTSLSDPLGATFDQIYNGSLNYVVWNDQFYKHPPISGCTTSCSGPWGHSKGMIAWDNQGNGLVVQVTTPSWPGSGNASAPRKNDGNTLGCVTNNNAKFGQHFFALRLNPADTLAVLGALQNASVVTNVADRQLARIGGPSDLQAAARALGKKSRSTQVVNVALSTGIRLIGKPSALQVPPWQFVSATLGGVPLRTATWWDKPLIPTTGAGDAIDCWRNDLGTPGRVEIATDGKWEGTAIGLKGGIDSADHNHGKLGVSLDNAHPYVIFGDLNQQGVLNGQCQRSQNGRGGLFFVLENAQLQASMLQLLAGGTAPVSGAPPAERGASR